VLFSSLVTKRLRHNSEAVSADDQISKPEVDQLAERTEKLIVSSISTKQDNVHQTSKNMPEHSNP
jgi:two-component system chemotaxis response regulator CheV